MTCVVALLIWLIWPVLTPGRGTNWRRDDCMSNLRQIGLGLVQYAEDYDESEPVGLRPELVNGRLVPTGLGWACQEWPYVKSIDEFACPLDSTRDKSGQGSVVSFALNSNIPKKPYIVQWTNPVLTVMLFEVSGASSPLDTWPNAAQLSNIPLSPAGDGTANTLYNGIDSSTVRLATGNIGLRLGSGCKPGRHDGGANYLFGDGHAEWISPDRVSTGADAWNAQSTQTGLSYGRAAGTADRVFTATFSTR